ncbi:hypothetical protein N7509_000892 [Penicillium cosmopolitanum]|uniref:Phosphoribulokinase/uridine kinase domain-containing protein n=1 Tax=Penicillium cosmopolitanum TaxID=1131564 RepID=A0A9W9WB46_9EURO|nr:uncharacterized protein N7509_000892 [Penicillium cosmopolitanum]KAJ5414265.1 hypothetical protein N7509_000892 [Penicillium cosmopolitanum]
MAYDLPDPIAYMVGISGPSSSGKTTLARLLHRIFSGAKVHIEGAPQYDQLHTFMIHEDDFYKPDNKIPYVTLPSGTKIQDWDTPTAIDTDWLSMALSYARMNGRLPNSIASKEDQNASGPTGVPETLIAELRQHVEKRLSSVPASYKMRQSIAFLEGFLLFAPPKDRPSIWGEEHPSQSIHESINLSLFLPASYTNVKARREGRDGYVTIGGDQPPPGPGMCSKPEIDLDTAMTDAPQNFWVDPPGYVDDIVWPRYLKYHEWLLIPVDERAAAKGDWVQAFGEGEKCHTDVGVRVAPGEGAVRMDVVLRWAVEEVLAAMLKKYDPGYPAKPRGT